MKDKTPPEFFIIHYVYLEKVNLNEFMIAEQYQGKGYAKHALQIWLKMIKSENKYNSIILCYIEGNDVAANLYESVGFNNTGEVDEDEVIMEYKIMNNG